MGYNRHMVKRLILVSNDDGALAPGLKILLKVASRFGRVVVVAPDRDRSAVSSAISLQNILRVQSLSDDYYTCSGTPVDCVLLGVRAILERSPDWVLTGVNRGFNFGEDVFYSGTVGAAFEGCLQGAMAAAFSMDSNGNLIDVECWLQKFLERWEGIELPKNRIWNVNFPKHEAKGFRITSQGNRVYDDLVEQRLDPRKDPYFWIGGGVGPTYSLASGSDAQAAMEGYISLTPLRLDLACPEVIARRDIFDANFNI